MSQNEVESLPPTLIILPKYDIVYEKGASEFTKRAWEWNSNVIPVLVDGIHPVKDMSDTRASQEVFAHCINHVREWSQQEKLLGFVDDSIVATKILHSLRL